MESSVEKTVLVKYRKIITTILVLFFIIILIYLIKGNTGFNNVK
jgi:hypothetical protein